MTEKHLNIKRVTGEVLARVKLPMSAADVPLSHYVAFLNELKKLELEDANPMQIMAQAVGELTGVDLGTILLAKVGEQWQQDKELDGGIRSLYGWAVNALTNYKGVARTIENFSFEYKGEAYRIPLIIASELAGGLPVLPEVETVEAVEAFETMRTFQQQIKDLGDPKKDRAKRIIQLKTEISKQGDAEGAMMREIRRLEAETELEGDPNGNMVFAQYLRMIAILSRKEGERLPTNDGDRERWIQARMIHMQEIDTKTALDVDFFLMRLSALSKQINPLISSFIHPLFILAQVTQSRPQPKERRTIAQWRTKKKYSGALVGVR